MPLPWLIGVAVIAAGAAIYNAVKEDDTPSTSDNSAERAEAARKAQKEKERDNKKSEIIADAKELLTDIYKKHKHLIDVKNESIDDGIFFLKLKNIANIKLTDSSCENETIEFLSHFKSDTCFSGEQKKQDNNILLLNEELKLLEQFSLDLMNTEEEFLS